MFWYFTQLLLSFNVTLVVASFKATPGVKMQNHKGGRKKKKTSSIICDTCQTNGILFRMALTPGKTFWSYTVLNVQKLYSTVH